MNLSIFFILFLVYSNICVNGKPQIYELFNVTATTDTETRLICKVKGRPISRVFFKKLSNTDPFARGIQDHDSRIEFKQEIVKDKDEAVGTLIISKISRSDDGLYQCIAENPTGTAYKNGHIQVWFKPTFNRTRELPPVWSWDGRPGNLTCLPEAIPNATIVWRWNQVDISEENFNNGKIPRNSFQVIGRGPSSVLIVKPLYKRSYFTFYECIARNELGEASIKIQLKQGFRPGAVNQVRVHTITATTIKFEIVPPSNFDGMPIRSYHVQYKPELQESWDYSLTHTWNYGSPYILEHLTPEVTYHFRLAAENDVGRGTWTNVQTQTMPGRSEPAKPTFLLTSSVKLNIDSIPEVEGPFSNHFELRWNVPAENGEPIEHYSIRYCVMDMADGDYREKDCNDNIQQSVQYTNFLLERLLPNTLYKIELSAHNAIGDSSPAQLLVRTARDERSGSGVMCANFAFLPSFLFLRFVLL